MSRVVPLVALVAGYVLGRRSARDRQPRTIVYSPTTIEANFTRAYADTLGADVPSFMSTMSQMASEMAGLRAGERSATQGNS